MDDQGVGAGALAEGEVSGDVTFAQLGKFLDGEVTTWTEQSKAEGRAEGRVEGRLEGRVEGRREGRIAGRIAGLATQACQKFGDLSARKMAAMLEPVTSEAVLDEVATWMLTCVSEDALYSNIRYMLERLYPRRTSG